MSGAAVALYSTSFTRRLVAQLGLLRFPRLWRRFGPWRLLANLTSSSRPAPWSPPPSSRARDGRSGTTWRWASCSSWSRWPSPWPGRSWPPRERLACSRAGACHRLLLRQPSLPPPHRRPRPDRHPAPARGAPQRAAVELRERGDPRAEDASVLAQALPRHPRVPRDDAGPAGRVLPHDASGHRALNGTINNVLNAAMYTDRRWPTPGPSTSPGSPPRDRAHRHPPPAPKEAIRYEGPEALRVSGDAQALETAVLNLLDNAVKYSKERVEIEMEVWGDADGQAHVRVRDHGIGMSRTHLPFIFTRFYRIGAEVRRSRTGTGLGLFIVRAIVKGTGARSPPTARAPTGAPPSPSACPASSSRRPSRTRRRPVPRCCWSRTRTTSRRGSASTSSWTATRWRRSPTACGRSSGWPPARGAGVGRRADHRPRGPGRDAPGLDGFRSSSACARRETTRRC